MPRKKQTSSRLSVKRIPRCKVTRHLARLLCLALLSSVVLTGLLSGSGRSMQTGQSTSTCRRPLRVVVYPFVPRYRETLYEIKARFEGGNPAIELKFVDLSGNYYAETDKNGQPAAGFVGTADADVIELDSVFLEEFVSKAKIQPLPQDARLPDSELLKNAIAGATVNNMRYGSPHWVCGNFLFFRADDTAMRNVRTLKDLESVIAASGVSVGSGLTVDLKGSSTLGEFYLEAAVDQHTWPNAAKYLGTVEKSIEDRIRRLMRLCEPGLCRDYHGTEVYARAFARREARILIGYSETLNRMLSETTQACRKSDGCLRDADVDVAQLSLDDTTGHQISWVDSFVVSASCNGQCVKDAASFIQFMNQDETYKRILQPGPYDLPAYLLPAKSGLYSDAEVSGPAHLYPKLRSIIEGAATPTGNGLNELLRADGKQVDADLEK